MRERSRRNAKMPDQDQGHNPRRARGAFAVPVAKPATARSAGLSSKPDLATLQRLMAQTIMRPLTSTETMQREASTVAEQIILPNDRLAAFERLQIYNQQYWWRLLGNFGEDFPGLRAVLGETVFDRLAIAYLEECGSTSWNLRDLGSKLPDFVKQHPELTAPRHALAFDMARVEWARVVAFDGPEHPAIDPKSLQKARPERLRFELQPHITLLELSYPIDELLRKLKESDVETDSLSNAVVAKRPRRRVAISARPSRHAVFLAVHRVDFSVYYKRLEPEAFRVLVALQSGATVAAACENAFRGAKELPEQSAAKVQTWFATWARFNWLWSRRH
jgi:hypothetical protein